MLNKTYLEFAHLIETDWNEYCRLCQVVSYQENMFVKNLTPYDLAMAFPDESLELIPGRLKVLKVRLKLAPSMTKEITEQIKFYEQVLHIINIKDNKPSGVTESKLRNAHNKPIEEMYAFQKVHKHFNRISCLCPFHDDSKASFIIYNENNSFYCFGCCLGGDSIDFYMKLNKVGFKQAVEALQ